MKKILAVLFALLLILPLGVDAKAKTNKATKAKTQTQTKVKVYIFEAGGCPYCEAELEQLLCPLKSMSFFFDSPSSIATPRI